jgi:dihydroorotase
MTTSTPTPTKQGTLTLRNATMYAGTGPMVVDIGITDDIISHVGPNAPRASIDIDLAGLVVLPGAIDPHVHVRDLGQSYKEDWKSAGAAALAGGYTTIFDMPNTVPATETAAALEQKRTAAARSPVDRRFWLGATEYNLADLEFMLLRRHPDVAGIKVFLAGSSSNEIVHHSEQLRLIMRLAAQFDVPVAVHQELQSCLDRVETEGLDNHARHHGRYRPGECALAGTALAGEIAIETGCRLYLVHVSTAEEIELIRRLKPRGRIFAEVTPHHLFIDESILEAIGNVGKVNPPLRLAGDNASLLDAVNDGTIDTVGSDHAPHALAEKALPYDQAPSGFPGLETSLALLADAVHRKLLCFDRVREITSATPARLFGLFDRGQVAPGKRADLAIIDPLQRWTVQPECFHTKAHYSPFAGRQLTGRVTATVHRGLFRTTQYKEG